MKQKKPMKTLPFVLLALTSIFFSCNKETSVPIESWSSDKTMKITVSASRAGALDAWMVDIQLTHGGETSKVFQEFYADEVSNKNVSFEWKSNHACIIHFTQRDGAVIDVPVKVGG